MGYARQTVRIRKKTKVGSAGKKKTNGTKKRRTKKS